MHKSLVKRIEQLQKPLSPIEKRLVDVLMNNPEAAAFESINRLAAMAETHGSALVRLARKLGFSGFPEMRTCLRGGLTATQRTDDLVRTSLSDSQETGILAHLVQRETDALGKLSQFVSQRELDAAADQLLAAERTVIFGEGTAEALARHATHRLRRAGQLTVQLDANPRAIAEGLTFMSANDLALGFCLREPPALLCKLLEKSRSLGAKTAVISDLSGLAIKPAPDVLLAASRGPETESSTLTVPMTLLNALILTVASRGAPETLESYTRYTSQRDQIT